MYHGAAALLEPICDKRVTGCIQGISDAHKLLINLVWTALVLFAASLLGKREPLRERLSRRPVLLCACLTLGVIVILLFGSYGIGYDAGDFIYGQF